MFECLVIEAVSALPLRVREAMKNVAIVIEQEPRRKKSRAVGIKRREVLLGLYEGIPLIRRDSGYFGVLPDKITIFQKPVEALSKGSEENITALVREVVWHEIGHHFGLSDSEISIIEKKRKKPARRPVRKNFSVGGSLGAGGLSTENRLTFSHSGSPFRRALAPLISAKKSRG